MVIVFFSSQHKVQIENLNLFSFRHVFDFTQARSKYYKMESQEKECQFKPIFERGDFNFIFSIFMYIRYAFYMQHEYDLLENSEECKTQWPTKSPKSLMEAKKKTA